MAHHNNGDKELAGRREHGDRLKAENARLLAELHEARIALIRKRRSHCEAVRFETEDERPVHVWGPSQYLGRDMCQRCTTEREWAEDPDADEVVLLAEVDRLRARVAELETAQAPAGPYPQLTSYVVEMSGMWSPTSHKRASLNEAQEAVASYRAHFPAAPYRIVRWVETSALVETDDDKPKASPPVEDPHWLGHGLPESPRG